MLAGCTTGLGAVGTCMASAAGLYALLFSDAERSGTATGGELSPDALSADAFASIPSPRIYSRSEWGARPVNLEAENEYGYYSDDNPEGWLVYENPLHEAYQTVVVHHSALYEDDDLSTVWAVQNLHIDDRGWADIGYHFLVGREGTLFAGRDLTVRGTHTAQHNTGSVGVCLLGNLELNEPTAPQLAAAQAIINWLALRLQLTHLAGHTDFNAETVCPGARLRPLLQQMAIDAGLVYGTEGYVLPDWITPAEDEAETADATTRYCPLCSA